MYLLSRKKRKEVCEFIKEQLWKRYVRPLKLPDIALVFFVGKKSSKKRIVQNYKYLNKWTIKDKYSLSLIWNIVENIGTKKLSTKLDL